METKTASSFWWLKSSSKTEQEQTAQEPELNLTSTPQLEIDISSSLADFLDKENTAQNEDLTDGDIGSIIEEINRVAAQSPLGPYDKSMEERSVEEIMKEAERIYMESSKSFEQLSSRSKTSLNVTELHSQNSKHSTPTPKSVSPLPLDDEVTHKRQSSESDSYSEDFSEESHNPSPIINDNIEKSEQNLNKIVNLKQVASNETFIVSDDKKEDILNQNETVRVLEYENKILKEDIKLVKMQFEETNALLEQAKLSLNAQGLRSPEINVELEKALEDLKDTKEVNTALQLQLDTLNKTHQVLKQSYDELVGSNKTLERRVHEFDSTLSKYRDELLNMQKQRDKLLENETNLSKLLEIEKLQSKSIKLQNEKDAKCIQDLNRQIKEMERIITRKHPDSVSALIVAAKTDASESNLTARKVLEDRIKMLEHEAVIRDAQSSKVFLEVQEKFNQMKLKYESHIEDLELHVSDLKNQLKRKADTFDVYTQTVNDDQKIPQKETSSRFIQTEPLKNSVKRLEKVVDTKEETHLIATIRGLQADLSNKEKVINKLNKEVEEMKRTNRRLQKEREGSLKNLHEKREFRSYPEKLALQSRNANSTGDLNERLEDELKAVRSERDKLKTQLCRMEGDYQGLKTKRLQDLTALQEAHEREIATYMSNITPLREQLEVQQVSLATLQTQLSAAKEELAIVTVERDHLNNRLSCRESIPSYVQNGNGNGNEDEVGSLYKKISYLEKRYEEREYRLRAIVQGLAQKNITNKSCEQCAARQQQLIGYKAELDQILATLRTLQ